MDTYAKLSDGLFINSTFNSFSNINYLYSLESIFGFIISFYNTSNYKFEINFLCNSKNDAALRLFKFNF